MKRVILPLFFFSLLISSCATSDKSGAEREPAANGGSGAEFKPIPIDVESKCSAYVLKGTKRYEGSAFMMPQAFLRLDEDGESIIEIGENEDSQPTLTFGLRFPKEGEKILARRGHESIQQTACTLAQVSNEVKKIDPSVNTVAPIGLYNIQVGVRGIKGTDTIGNTKTDILGYFDGDFDVTITLTEKEKVAIIKQLRAGRGLTVEINYKFMAQSTIGYANVRFNAKNLSTKLSTALKAQAVAGGGITSVGLRSAVQSALSEVGVQITQEAGTDTDFEGLTKDLIKNLTQVAIDATKSAAPEAPKKEDAKAELPEGNKTSIADVIPKAGLDAAIDYVKTLKSYEFTQQKLSKPEETTYTAYTKLNCTDTEPGIYRLRLKQSNPARPAPIAVNAGTEIRFAQADLIKLPVSYKEKTYYYSKEKMLKDEGFLKAFPRVAQHRKDGWWSSDGWTGIGEYTTASGDSIAFIKSGLGITGHYIWGGVWYEPQWETPKTNELRGQELLKMPVEISFSRGPGKLSFEDLVNQQGKDLWSMIYNEKAQVYIFTALRDLGSMKFTNKLKSEMKFVPAHRYIQEEWNSFTNALRERTFVPEKKKRVPQPKWYSTIRIPLILKEDKYFQAKVEGSSDNRVIRGPVTP